MVICIESSFRRFSAPKELRHSYEQRFGALPDWLNELSGSHVLALLGQALRRGTPLIPADVLG